MAYVLHKGPPSTLLHLSPISAHPLTSPVQVIQHPTPSPSSVAAKPRTWPATSRPSVSAFRTRTLRRSRRDTTSRSASRTTSSLGEQGAAGPGGRGVYEAQRAFRLCGGCEADSGASGGVGGSGRRAIVRVVCMGSWKGTVMSTHYCGLRPEPPPCSPPWSKIFFGSSLLGHVPSQADSAH